MRYSTSWPGLSVKSMYAFITREGSEGPQIWVNSEFFWALKNVGYVVVVVVVVLISLRPNEEKQGENTQSELN